MIALSHLYVPIYRTRDIARQEVAKLAQRLTEGKTFYGARDSRYIYIYTSIHLIREGRHRVKANAAEKQARARAN